MAEGEGNVELLGGWLDVSTPNRLEGGALLPKLICVGRRDAVASGNATMTT